MNPRFGLDAQGGSPPDAPLGGQMYAPGQPYIPHHGMGSYGLGHTPYGGYGGYSHPPSYPYAYPYPYPSPHAQYPYYQPNGANNTYGRDATGLPTLAPSMPAANLANTSGGVGCEPGYNYFFSAAHTKIHVFKTPTPPWQLPPSTGIEFHASHVPVTTTLAEILKGFGASGPTPKKNRCYEIAQAGNGRWYKGLSFGGDEKDMMKKSIKEIGWDETRNGQPGGKPVLGGSAASSRRSGGLLEDVSPH
ncbi:uncharacterized protein VDAG_02187 [Verticillium dahliae VdLs.17]|uniref:Uncharacterized protein n=1 Tax=Verticillium dahliae (strain VdLs.17 / ATCC MYA-4575 / FGSC 10137) TaxID=498257 RepID=G2WV46_VERDV|nr:uncharacterized protein VDAG_02187 [Verticillium dahliae VdLs.17]EGY20171.1 hypothetical protein VDAG_02187 [Verticillium dahliae VdLs.17]